MKSGIYKIVNKVNGKLYIGSAVSFNKRWNVHKCDFRKGGHHNPYFQRSWDKYGEDTFVFSIVLYCSPEDLLFYEQRAIDVLKPEYNISPTAGNCLGVKQTPESIEKRRLANLGKKRSAKTCAKIRDIHRGKVLSEETKKKISKSKKGTPSWNKGVPMREESKEKLRGVNRVSAPRRKEVLQYDLEDNFIKEFISVRGATRSLGLKHPSVYNVIIGKQKTAGGYKWKYKEIK